MSKMQTARKYDITDDVCFQSQNWQQTLKCMLRSCLALELLLKVMLPAFMEQEIRSGVQTP